MKRWIHAREAALQEYAGYTILFEDSIVIDVDISDAIKIVESSSSFDRYPGNEQFANDMIKILQDEYKCVLVPRSENGKLYHISVSNSGVSVYFTVIYDFRNFKALSSKLGRKESFAELDVGVLCSIEFRFSDHRLTTGMSGDSSKHVVNEMNYAKRLHPEIEVAVSEQVSIEVEPKTLMLYYNEALKDFQSEFNQAIRRWANSVVEGIRTGKWDKFIKWS